MTTETTSNRRRCGLGEREKRLAKKSQIADVCVGSAPHNNRPYA